ncbi:MAG: UDP-N-acetyl-D-mannosamine dehydrogenase [Porticoccaceae bacterium]
MERREKVCVMGLGYIGLPTAALLASKGYIVTGVDSNPHVVETINQGNIHIIETDLDAYVRSTVVSGHLRAVNTAQESDIYMICVPTPFHKEGAVPQPNIDFVLSATQSIAPFVKAGDLVILESTLPVGTTEHMESVLQKKGVNTADIHIAYCPERVLPGRIMIELVENDRVVGGMTPEATRKVADFYRTFVDGEILETNAKTAEMCKLTENSFRDVNIAFANELSLICDKEGIDVWELIQLSNRHPRVNILQPGAGVGGHCIAVDPWFIVARDQKNARLIRMAREVNNYKTDWVVDQIKLAANNNAKSVNKLRIACLGLAFKPDIDDLRESPALEIAKRLKMQNYNVVAVEPNIESHELFELISLDQALQQADVLVVLVKHREFLSAEKKAELIDVGAFDFCGALA